MLTALIAQSDGAQGAIKGLSGILQLYGGWGVASVCIVGFVAYYRHQSKISEKRNDKFIELLQECASILGQTEASHTKLEDALRSNKQSMEGSQKVLERVERILDNR